MKNAYFQCITYPTPFLACCWTFSGVWCGEQIRLPRASTGNRQDRRAGCVVMVSHRPEPTYFWCLLLEEDPPLSDQYIARCMTCPKCGGRLSQSRRETLAAKKVFPGASMDRICGSCGFHAVEGPEK
eukprot:g42058.t1